MKKISLPLAGFALAAMATTALAFIPPEAVSSSHELAEAAEAIHDYLHDNYPSSYGAHGLETESETLHDDLHDWSMGLVPESQIASDWDAVDAAYKSFKQGIHQAHVLNKGDEELDDLFDDTKQAFKDLRFLLKKVQG